MGDYMQITIIKNQKGSAASAGQGKRYNMTKAALQPHETRPGPFVQICKKGKACGMTLLLLFLPKQQAPADAHGKGAFKVCLGMCV